MVQLQSPQPPSAQSILTTLINEIAALPAPFIFVLDDYHVIDAAPIDDALAFLFSPKDGMAPFTDITQVVTGKTPWQLFLYKCGMGQSALAVGVLLLAALIALRIFFGLIGWLVSPITGLFGQR